MQFVILFWLSVGIFNWLMVFIEFKNVSYLRPGLVELAVGLVLGPTPQVRKAWGSIFGGDSAGNSDFTVAQSREVGEAIFRSVQRDREHGSRDGHRRQERFPEI
jgi:hypothetical protein